MPSNPGSHYYVCCHPDCELSTGPIGIDIVTLEERSALLALDDPSLLPGVLPCPICASSGTTRDGTLLAVPTEKHEAAGTVIASTFGKLGHWFVAKPSLAIVNSARRVVEFSVAEASDDSPDSKYVSGPPVITGVVLRPRPFDGHILSFGNQDKYINAKWNEVEPRYGPNNDPPTGSTDEPTYVRELQKDLLLLAYMGKGRFKSNNVAGIFDVHTLGAVLSFKQDLVDLYKVPANLKGSLVPAGKIEPESFSQPILYPSSFVAPARILRAWDTYLTNNRSVTARLGRIARLLSKRDAREKTRAKLEKQAGPLEAILDELPFRVVLETPEASYAPFEERAPTMAVDELTPTTATPAHSNATALLNDPAFDQPGMNGRLKNRNNVRKHAAAVIGSVTNGLKHVANIRPRLAKVSPKPEDSVAWQALAEKLESVADLCERVLGLVKFFVLNLSTQIAPWLDHLKEVGVVDQATAVYLKALREGGRIGPSKRPAYRLALNPPDFDDVDAGAQHIRDECRSRGDNRKKGPAKTMPEILALQFFANESRMKFTTTLRPFNLSAEDKNTRFPKVGIDMNCAKKGTFDPATAHAGDWIFARGWGVGQETEQNGKVDGVQLHHGLPVMDPEAKEVVHPKSFADNLESFNGVIERKAIKRFRKRKGRRDCSYAETGKAYYDCHSCMARFHEEDFLGTGKGGAGGVVVPRSETTFGDPSETEGFWLDLERATEFARAGGASLDRSATEMYDELFSVDVPELDDHVLEVLERGTNLPARIKIVSEARGIDAEDLKTRVLAHINARRDLPCSWCHVRIRYTGQGAQAFHSLKKLFNIVGALKTEEVVKKHIVAASELRRKEHLGD